MYLLTDTSRTKGPRLSPAASIASADDNQKLGRVYREPRHVNTRLLSFPANVRHSNCREIITLIREKGGRALCTPVWRRGRGCRGCKSRGRRCFYSCCTERSATILRDDPPPTRDGVTSRVRLVNVSRNT